MTPHDTTKTWKSPNPFPTRMTGFRRRPGSRVPGGPEAEQICTCDQPHPVHGHGVAGHRAGQPRRPRRVMDPYRHIRGVSRTLMLLAAVLILIATVQAQAPRADHGPYEAVSDEIRYSHHVQGGYASTIHVDVIVRSGIAPDAARIEARDGGVLIVVPSLDPEQDLYGLHVETIQTSAGIKPLLLWAEPERGGERLDIDDTNGAELVYETVVIKTAGTHRLIASTDRDAGQLIMDLRLDRAESRSVVQFIDRDLVRIAAATALLASLALTIILFSEGRRRVRRATAHPGMQDIELEAATGLDEDPDARVIEPKPVPRVLPPGVTGFGRMEPRLDGVRDWDIDEDGLPERLARMEGRGWVIRID